MDEREYNSRLNVFAEIQKFAQGEMSKRLKAKYKPDPVPEPVVAEAPVTDADPLADFDGDIDSLLTE